MIKGVSDRWVRIMSNKNSRPIAISMLKRAKRVGGYLYNKDKMFNR